MQINAKEAASQIDFLGSGLFGVFCYRVLWSVTECKKS